VINNQEAPTGTVGVAYPSYQFTAINGLPPLLWSETGSLPIGLGLSSSGVLSGTPNSFGQFPITLNVIDALSRSAAPFPTILRVSLARPPASFTLTGSMKVARSGHAATLLLSGKVLVTGGGNNTADPTAELYDPATGTFSTTTGNMTEARIRHTATLLKFNNPAAPNYGKVLIVGSVDTTAELYDPSTTTFAATGSMLHARTEPTATLLNTGKVLIVGGNTTGELAAELYNPASGTFADTGSTTTLRTGHTATLLLDGQVLIAGGGSATAELYNPSSGTFTPTAGDMTEPRSGHTATLLGAADGAQNGYVLIIGTDGSADLYDPSTQVFTRVGSPPPYVASPFLRQVNGLGHAASLRTDGTVLTAGGEQRRGCGFLNFGVISVNLAALFAPESDGFTYTGSLNTPRDTHTATLLQDGTVIIIGGLRRSQSVISGGIRPSCLRLTTVLSSAELFK
jgi:hypothetical protein